MTERKIIAPTQKETIELIIPGLEHLPEVMAKGGISGEIAEEIMARRNFVRGYEAAISIQSPTEFQVWFDLKVVGEFIGPWAPKRAALDGARAAFKLGQTSLTGIQIYVIEKSYKENKPNHLRKPKKIKNEIDKALLIQGLK